MGQVTSRTSQTSRGLFTLSPWTDSKYKFTILQLNIGSNPLSLIEIVSSLNSFNLGHYMYEYHYPTRTEKYNPKVYIGTIQTAASIWNLDNQDPTKVDPKWAAGTQEKSGSLYC